MLKAELGDILYYIIFAVVILAGLFEKVAKSKRQQQQAGTPRPPQPYDDFEDVAQPSQRQTPPQTIEEMMKRMLEGVENPQQEETASSEESQSLEVIPEKTQTSEYIPLSGRHFYHPEEVKVREQSYKTSYKPIVVEEKEEEKEVSKLHEYEHEFEFDIRQAVISSEILNRKY